MQTAWYDHWLNPFGNYDDPWPAPEYKPELTAWKRKLAWWARNPLHNFFFHWVGVAERVVRFKGTFLAPGWNFAWTYTEHLQLPLISYRGQRWEWYVGWRRNGGFGIAFRKSYSKLDSGRAPA
jgi:hypothetical protein